MAESTRDLALLRRMWPFLRPWRWWLVASMALTPIGVGAGLLQPLILKEGIDEHIASPLLDGENPQFGHIGVVSQTLAVDPQRQVAAFDDEQAVALRGHRDFGQWAAIAGHVGITGLGCELARAFALGIPGPGDGGYGDGERLCGGRGLGHGGFGTLRWTELQSVYQVK